MKLKKLKHSISQDELIEIGNPGASGSIFYKTSDDKFIFKTASSHESQFLRKILAGYAFVPLFFHHKNI